MVHFYRNVSHLPAGKLREVVLMLKAITPRKTSKPPSARRRRSLLGSTA
jgi:hypothetical protein